MNKYLSTADLIVIIVTALLFVAALFTKGLSHDLFLEAGVLLVSIKIIIMKHKNIISVNLILSELDTIKGKLSEMSKKENDD